MSPQSPAFRLIVSSLQISSFLSDLLSSQENHIMLLGESHPPPTSVPLSLSWASFAIVSIRSNPNLWGSLTGAPFNCLVQAAASWGENDSTQVARSSLLPLCTAVVPSVRMLALPCYSLQPAPSPVTQGLFIPGCLMCNKKGLKFQKRGKRQMNLEASGPLSTTFLPLPTLIRHNVIPFSKCGREAGVASTFTACR